MSDEGLDRTVASSWERSSSKVEVILAIRCVIEGVLDLVQRIDRKSREAYRVERADEGEVSSLSDEIEHVIVLACDSF